MVYKEEDYWKEEADRINKMAEQAKKSGRVIEVGNEDPPELNKDGSLKERDK